MAQQLIFTSAVAGLNPGSSGYCTVARSETMRDAVVTRLEQWSVYTHNAGGQNPVVCAYRVLNLRGSVFHVLTRIVDSGLDYTGRTNFLAHHLVFQPHEIHGACSPAEVFLQWLGWEKQWQGGPRYLEDGLSLHSIPRSTRMPASTWKEWTGDAGAATLLVAEGGGGATARSVDLVVPASAEAVLPHLYAESLHLIDSKGENAPAAWAVPFTTFLQSQDDPGDFRWRGFSPANRMRAAGEVLIDFANKILPPIQHSGFIEYARTGERKAAFLPGVRAAAIQENPAITSFAPVPSVATVLQAKSRVSQVRNKKPVATATDTAKDFALPRWVLISMLAVIPLGITAGFWLAKKKTYEAADKGQPPNVATASSNNTGVSPEKADTVPIADPTQTPPAQAADNSAAVQKQADEQKQARRDSAIKHANDIYEKQSNLDGDSINELAEQRNRLSQPSIGESDIRDIESKLAVYDVALTENSQSLAELRKLPDNPVYFINTTGGSVKTQPSSDGLGKALKSLYDRLATEGDLEITASNNLAFDAAQTVHLTTGDNYKCVVHLNASSITFDEKSIVFETPTSPLCLRIQKKGKGSLFYLVCYDSPEKLSLGAAHLSYKLFAASNGGVWSIKKYARDQMQGKLDLLEDVSGHPLLHGLMFGLGKPELTKKLYKVLREPCSDQAKDKLRKTLLESQSQVDLTAIIDWLRVMQTPEPQKEAAPPPPAQINWDAIRSSQQALPTAFNSWMEAHHVSATKLGDVSLSGRKYFDFLRSLLKSSFLGGDAFADTYLSTIGVTDRFTAIQNIPNKLREVSKDKKHQQEADKINNLADVWQGLFGSNIHKDFLNTDNDIPSVNSPSVASAVRVQVPPNYNDLIDALQKTQGTALELYWQVTLDQNQSAKIVELSPDYCGVYNFTYDSHRNRPPDPHSA